MSDERPAPTWIAALSNVPVQFWACDVHDRGRVEWRGDVAHCLEDGCGRTSEQPAPTARETAAADGETIDLGPVTVTGPPLPARETAAGELAEAERTELVRLREIVRYMTEPDAEMAREFVKRGRERDAARAEAGATYTLLHRAERERDVARSELERLRAEQHEVRCPSCEATIRARLSDQEERATAKDRVRLSALKPIEQRAREVAADSRNLESTRHAARYILGEEER